MIQYDLRKDRNANIISVSIHRFSSDPLYSSIVEVFSLILVTNDVLISLVSNQYVSKYNAVKLIFHKYW